MSETVLVVAVEVVVIVLVIESIVVVVAMIVAVVVIMLVVSVAVILAVVVVVALVIVEVIVLVVIVMAVVLGRSSFCPRFVFIFPIGVVVSLFHLINERLAQKTHGVPVRVRIWMIVVKVRRIMSNN